MSKIMGIPVSKQKAAKALGAKKASLGSTVEVRNILKPAAATTSQESTDSQKDYSSITTDNLNIPDSNETQSEIISYDNAEEIITKETATSTKIKVYELIPGAKEVSFNMYLSDLLYNKLCDQADLERKTIKQYITEIFVKYKNMSNLDFLSTFITPKDESQIRNRAIEVPETFRIEMKILARRNNKKLKLFVREILYHFYHNNLI